MSIVVVVWGVVAILFAALTLISDPQTPVKRRILALLHYPDSCWGRAFDWIGLVFALNLTTLIAILATVAVVVRALWRMLA